MKVLYLVVVLTLFSSSYCRADITKEDYCLEHPNSDVCDTIYLKEVKIAQESQVKHLRDISVNLKEIAEQLALIREKLEGVKK